MELVRILGKDSRSATDEVLAKYGENALIISNQRLNGKNELIVAVDIAPETQLESENSNANQHTHNVDFANIFESKLSNNRRPVKVEDSAKAAPPESVQRDSLRARELVELVRGELTALKNEINLAKNAGVWQGKIHNKSDLQPLIDGMESITIPTALRLLLIDHISKQKSIESAKKEMKTLNLSLFFS